MVGQAYEREAIKSWYRTFANPTDPNTGVKLDSKKVLPNILVRKMALEWIDSHPSAGPKGDRAAEGAAERAVEGADQGPAHTEADAVLAQLGSTANPRIAKHSTVQ